MIRRLKDGRRTAALGVVLGMLAGAAVTTRSAAAADTPLAARLTSMVEADCRAALAGDRTKLSPTREYAAGKVLDLAREVDRVRAAWDEALAAVDTTRSAMRRETGLPRYAASVKSFTEAELGASALRKELGIALGKATGVASLLDVIDHCSKIPAAPSAASSGAGAVAHVEPQAADEEIQAAAEFTASAIILTLETLRIREAAAEIDAAQRRQEVRAAIERLRSSPVESTTLDVLRYQRRRAADALLASAESQLAGARWPTGDEPRTYELWSRIELDFARSHLARIDAEGADLTWTLRPVAMVVGWTVGRSDGDMVFNGLEQEIETAITRTLSNLPQVAPVAPSATTSTANGADRGSRTIEVAASRQWTATGVMLAPGAVAMIEAFGTVEASTPQDRSAFHHQVPPTGRGAFFSYVPQPMLPALSLIGRIGEGPVLSIGVEARLSATPPYGSGELLLGINDDTLQDNSGAWTVRITVFEGSPTPPPSAGVVPPTPPPPPAMPSPPPPTADQGKWTAWLNRDQPRDSADFEGLGDFGSAVPCPEPVAIECRTVDGRDWSTTGQRYICSLEGANPGGMCVNAENPGGCLDYEVRFRCP